MLRKKQSIRIVPIPSEQTPSMVVVHDFSLRVRPFPQGHKQRCTGAYSPQARLIDSKR